MRRMTAPGLPSWPPLWFDQRSKRAVIRARFPTWRGFELGIKVTRGLVLLNIPVCMVVAWKLTPTLDKFVLRLIVFLVIWSVIYTLSVRWMRYQLPALLSRQLFASRVSLWFTSQAIAFKSKLYRRGVVLARNRTQSDISVQFNIDECPAAKWQASGLDPKRQETKAHFELGRRLMIVVSGVDARTRLSGSESLIRKSLPVCEMFEGDVSKLAVVCNAAQMLTEKETENHVFSNRMGVDIDAG
ncbi:MAG: hypothetical protein AAFV88_12430 [Planctomycetota bacterium]